MTLRTDDLPWARKERADLRAERDRANEGVDCGLADFRRQLDAGERIVMPRLVGVMMGDDLDEYKRLMDRALFNEGLGVQRHPLEQFGPVGTVPMYVKKGER